MPTGYTAAVQDGTITTFPEFAMTCARAFGALIMMRDDPSSAKIPERFEPSTSYHDEALDKAKKRLAELQVMDEAKIAEACAASLAESTRAAEDYRARKQLQADRYRAMIAQVDAWTPPTADHDGLKKFMLDQLGDSLRFDCGPDREDESPPPTPAEWHDAQLKKAKWDHDYHTRERLKEIERTEGRNRWVAQLRASLAEPTP